MVTKNKSKSAAIYVAKSCLLLSISGYGGQAMAQQTGSAAEEIAVTGSRIVRPGLTSPTPVTAIDQGELDALGPATLMDGLDALPQFLGSATLNDTQNFMGGGYLGSGGQAQLNLRGIGGNRTLVLVNGRRQPSTSRTGTFDISMLPQVLIRRTEIVTGGASAAYGSDAIAGVTNFIIDDTFEGLEVTVQGGLSELGDGGNGRISVGAGTKVGDKGHLVVGLEGFRTAEITDMNDRGWYRDWCNLDMGLGVEPRRIRHENCHSRAYTYGGMIGAGPLRGTMFLDDGSTAMFQETDVRDAAGNNPNAIAGNQVGGDGAQFPRDQMQRAGQERASLFMNYRHEFSDTLRGSVSAMYGRSHVDNQKVGYMLWAQWAPTIYSGNPYLPAETQAAMDENNVDSFSLNKRVVPSDPLHNGRAPLTTDVLTVSTTLDGEFSNGWNWNWYYQYGQSNRDVEMHGFRLDRLYRGIDAVRHPTTGAIVCASTLSYPDDGCRPVNILGVGNVSPEAMAWVHDKMYTDAKITQHMTEFVVNGELWEGFGAGPVMVAAGANWRVDKIDQVSGDALNSPLPPDGEGPVTSFDAAGNRMYRGLPATYEGVGAVIDRVGAATFDGSVNVWEVFGETIVPLIDGKRFAENVEASFAVRHTDYEQSGTVLSWKAGFSWSLNDELRLRLTRSRDMRAGNLSEMFDTTQLYAFMEDPWNPQQDIYTVKQITGGNPAVDPEKADTLTYGLVYQPSWMPGLSMTLDYFDISIQSAISTIGAQNIVNYCFEEGLFCDQIDFGPAGSGGPGDMIDSVDNTTLNVGAANTRGMDLEVGYRTPVTWFNRDDSMSIRVIASHLLESTITPFDSPPVSQLGVMPLQETQATLLINYMTGPVSLGWTTRWVSDGVQNILWQSGIDVDDNRVPSHHVSNLRVNWDLSSLKRDLSVYASVNNIFNKTPGDIRGFLGIYDILGRNYTVGMRARF